MRCSGNGQRQWTVTCEVSRFATGAPAERVGWLQNDVDAPSPAPSERASVPSLTSLEHGGGASDGSGPGVGRACGPLAGLGPLGPLGPLALPTLEPRA
ncbi:hypothetical protein HW555_005988 [Spodoptera exigua]|uniref:Uncharacterized protein n=1 Tax=Spodoptera exigua TaxID=7107 RepID=A0A835GIR9_SPOEX|nr:hypothetical protein HW555_005988 [Spodoptera exigua]KAH9643984.1 hypothetical protein HF086_004245 [Spodoptera exigua]